ncbi:MAG TPA: ribonuclease H-like domain-containing protein, partial [Chloroflexota bacterium]
MPTAVEDEWLWGWDPTPGIVSIWAERNGRAVVWRRAPESDTLTREESRFRPWLLLPALDDLAHLGARLLPEGAPGAERSACVTWRELAGAGHFRYLVSATDSRMLETAVLTGAAARLQRQVNRLADLGDDAAFSLPPEEQYLVATGRTYFGGLAFDHLRRLQFDLETTGLHPAKDRIFLVAVRDNRGFSAILDVAERGLDGPAAEADLIQRLIALIRQRDPDVIENHNLHGFDVPFLARRAELLGVTLALGRLGGGMRRRPAARGYGPWRSAGTDAGTDFGADAGADAGEREAAHGAGHGRYTVPGRELIDTLDAVRRYDFSARDLPGHGLKAVARHFGLASPDREYVAGAHVYTTWLADPERVRRYALDDVNEADGV